MSDSADELKPPPSFPLPDRVTEVGWKHALPLDRFQPVLEPEQRTARDRAPLLVVGALFAAADFAVIPLTEAVKQQDRGAVWVYVSFGLIVAQGVRFLAGWSSDADHFWSGSLCFGRQQLPCWRAGAWAGDRQ